MSVAICDDRLEIWSDGRLPFGLTTAILTTEHLSRPRNPLIAEVFFRRGLVKRWGRGTRKIVELCMLAGHPAPQFLEQGGAVGVRFVPSGYIAPLRVAHDFTNRQRLVLQVLSASPHATFGQIKKHVNPHIADRTLSVGGLSFTVLQASGPPLAVVATGPVAGEGLTQTFTFRFSDSRGADNLGVVNALINRALDATGRALGWRSVRRLRV